MSIWSRIERRLQGLAEEIFPNDITAKFDAARSELASGRFADGVAMLESLLADRPDHVVARCLLGATLLDKLGQPDKALPAFDAIVERHPDLVEGWLGRGEARLWLGEIEGAMADLRRARDLAAGRRPILARVYRSLGLAHRAAGDLDRAVRELRKAVAEDREDTVARTGLGMSLLEKGDAVPGGARTHLEQADNAAERALASIGLGRLDLIEGKPREAVIHFDLAVSLARRGAVMPVPGNEHQDALAGLGDVRLSLGDHRAAVGAYREALALDDSRPELHARLGDALLAGGDANDANDALASYRASLDRGAGADTLARALDAALAVDDLSAALPLAARLLADDPGNPPALLARGRSLVRAGQIEEARAAFRSATERDPGPRSFIELAELDLSEARAREAPELAASAAQAALRALAVAPADLRARRVLEAARRIEFGVRPPTDGRITTDPGLLYELADELRRLSEGRTELADAGVDAARAASDFDQPLLVTVMGEFSSGKSTFINAFIGQEVAPTGITPTTATINVVKYGRERGGRIVHRDGRVESLPWGELFTRLQALDAETARQVSLVEVLLPLESLARVSLVDTPGLNSILPEHEEVARRFIQRADAVVWLFSAQQAGKASERAALEQLAATGVRVLGVLNKVDQLAGDEVPDITRHVTAELAGLVEAVVPVSARRALGSPDDPAWRELSRILDERFFARAREIKRAVLRRRLEALLDKATGRAAEERRREQDLASSRRAQADQARAARDRFLEQSVARERRLLNEGRALLHREAAREVLDLVIPRQLPFGSHKASPADQDYLKSLLMNGYASLLADSRRRVDAELRQVGSDLLTGQPGSEDLLQALSDAVHILDAEVYAQTFAYLRGVLDGGAVQDFFRRALPKLQLEEDAVYHALFSQSPDLDAAIAVPLATAGSSALERLATRLDERAAHAEVRAFDLEVGLSLALADLRRRLEDVPP